MSILSAASAASVWRGYDYFIHKKVLTCVQTGESIFEGTVSGSGTNVYQVLIDIQHPRKSICDCPYAEGSRIVCKHKVALFFEAFPAEAVAYIQTVERYEEQVRQRELENRKRIEQYVNSLTVKQLRLELFKRLIHQDDDYDYDDYDDDDYDDCDFDEDDLDDEDLDDEDDCDGEDCDE